MASQDVKKVIGKILSDEEFLEQLKNDPDGTLDEFQLTQPEKDGLKDLDLTHISEAEFEIGKNIDTEAIKVHSVTVAF